MQQRHRFEQVSSDIQNINPGTSSSDTKEIVVIDVSTKFLGTVPLPDENQAIALNILPDKWICEFDAMEKFMWDRDPNKVGSLIGKLKSRQEIGRLHTYRWYLLVNITVSRWNRTVADDIS